MRRLSPFVIIEAFALGFALVLAILLVGIVGITPALAREAKCFVTHIGGYDCDFRPIGKDGSFEITTPDERTVSVFVEEPGKATGYINLNNEHLYADPEGADYQWTRPRQIPGLLRSVQDPACWDDRAPTAFVICAW